MMVFSCAFILFIINCCGSNFLSYLGSNIKYVGGESGRCYEFFKKYFVPQETIDLNISWPSNFFRKYFMAPPSILVSYLRLTFSSISG